MADAVDKNNLPSTPRPEYVAAAPDIALIRDLLAGTRRMHACHKTYIPKYPAEKPASYKNRATIAKVYGGLGRTLSATMGMLFAKPPDKSDQWTPEITEHWENLDGKDTHGDVVSKRKAEDATADGYSVVLIDCPPAPRDVVVHAGNEKALNLRPFWASYSRSDVLSWRTEIINNVETLTQVVLREGTAVSVGRFGMQAKLQYRVCTLASAMGADGLPEWGARWELLEERKDQSGAVTVVSVGKGEFRDRAGVLFDEIPVAVIYAGRTDAILTADPPLLDVAWANLEHWRVATNLRYYEDLNCFPQPTIKGELAGGGISADGSTIKPEFKLGPGVMVQVTKESEFLWTELTGTSISALRESLSEKKDEIAELGASFLAKKTRGVETAEAKRLDASAENSNLSTAAQGIEDGINKGLQLHAKYLGIPADQAPTITINRDFEMQAMDPQTMQVYLDACVKAGFPPRVMLEAWKAGGRLPEDTDIDEVLAEMLANAAATAANADTLPADDKNTQPADKAA